MNDPDVTKDEMLASWGLRGYAEERAIVAEMSAITDGSRGRRTHAVLTGITESRPSLQDLRRAYAHDEIDVETFEREVERVLREEDRP